VTGRHNPGHARAAAGEYGHATEPLGHATAQHGQATVELAGLLPLLAAIALAAYALLAGLSAGEQAGVAAEAGAIALLQDRDPAAAARGSLPKGTRATVRVEGRRVTVAVRPRVPLVAGLLRTRITAHAGPEPAP
jgi:hypothetical protein